MVRQLRSWGFSVADWAGIVVGDERLCVCVRICVPLWFKGALGSYQLGREAI